jgi:hypothetical protein
MALTHPPEVAPGGALPQPESQLAPSIENEDDQDSKDFKTAAKWQVALFGGGLATAALAIAIYSLTGPEGGETFSSLSLFGAAACVVGGFFGFLFGVPRSAVGIAKEDEGKNGQEVMSTQSVPSVTGSVSANTNLEQISDWLTKILVGATLTQLGNIPGAAAALFTAMSGAIGDRPSATAFVGALTVFSALMGFMFGWLVTRSYVGWIICTVDNRLKR